jgi:RHS repeat-associated protein
MRTETYDVTVASVLGKMKAQAAAFGPMETLLESTWYSYNGSGNVTDVQTQFENPAEGEPSLFETVFSYARNEKAVTAISGTTPGSGGNPPTSFARGFRYDAARERYRNNDTWSDYDSDIIHGDYRVDELDGVMEVTELRAYMPGIARVEDIDTAGTPPVRYYHTDMIGTTRFVTTLSGQPTDETVYTAFGEKVCSLPGGDCTNTTDHRYGYAGAYGYQSTINDTTGVADFPFLHVGARYYDPALGRFLQRDPIGILGGDNVYAYVANRPTVAVDPTGSQSYPTNPTPGSGWLPSPGSLPPGSPGWKLTPDGWVPKPVPPPPLPPSALVPVAACAAAAVAGAVAGRAIDNAVGRANGGFSISDGLADILFRWWNNDPDYDPSGGGGSGG